jgi:hypothetical protein
MRHAEALTVTFLLFAISVVVLEAVMRTTKRKPVAAIECEERGGPATESLIALFQALQDAQPAAASALDAGPGADGKIAANVRPLR